MRPIAPFLTVLLFVLVIRMDVCSFNAQNKQCVHTQSDEIWSPSSAYVHSAAAILWTGQECGVNYDLPGMVTSDLFR
jgi:hypothetical protein